MKGQIAIDDVLRFLMLGCLWPLVAFTALLFLGASEIWSIGIGGVLSIWGIARILRSRSVKKRKRAVEAIRMEGKRILSKHENKS